MPKQEAFPAEPTSTSPTLVPEDCLAAIFEMPHSPEAIDIKQLLSFPTKKQPDGECTSQQRNAKLFTLEGAHLSNQSIRELKDYESSFDQTRKRKGPF